MTDPHSDFEQHDFLQSSETQVHQQQAQQHHPHTQHLPMTEFVIDNPTQWLFDPSFGFPTDQMFSPHSDFEQHDFLQSSETQVHQQQAQQHHPHTQHLPMTEFVIDNPTQWLFDPSFGFPTDQMFSPHSVSQALPSSSHAKAEAQPTMNPQFLNYHFTLPTQAQMELLTPSFLESTSGGNALTAGFTAGLGLDTGNMHDYSRQQNDPLASMHAGYDGSKYAMQGISIEGPHYRGDYQQQQPAIPPQGLLHVIPSQTTNSGIGLGLGLGPQVNNTPTPSVLHHHLLPTTISPVSISNTAAAHSSLLSATAALTLPDNPAALNAKAPDPSLKLGKRRFVSLRVFNDGEAGFQRKVVR
ncbi:hypothetical protein QFC22_003965 [Naganishia vaughanmartiniae]|uniref:Uncharacterized protein n=1 Tax=Naganishia vaughanmartiniae TaxID=1424756 RepID=A0ACC2X5S5_9TREE|nr:hypothetical protein QFC22_003965 [Naganishia vaughanmartiniae]